MAKKYVLTGGPGVGKSTVLELMDRWIYKISEVATWVIENKKNRSLAPWIDREGFQKKVLETQLQWEREIPKEIKTAFLDRGVIDGIAYYNLDGLKAPKKLIHAAENSGYEKVFLLEPIMKYENTNIRREDVETARKIHQEIEKTYKSFGYNPIRIPTGKPRERIDSILKHLN